MAETTTRKSSTAISTYWYLCIDSTFTLAETEAENENTDEDSTSLNDLTFKRTHVIFKTLMGSYTANWLRKKSMTFLIFDFVAPKIQHNRLNVLDWNFDILLLEATEKQPLVWLGKKIFAEFDACKHLKIDESILENWLKLIAENYRSDNPYHNATHAADVLQAVAFYLNSSLLKDFFDPLEKIQCLISAVIHDTDHPGRNNTFLMNSNDDLAILYNDKAILESHHSALAFKLTLKNPNANIFQNLDSATYRTMRASIVDMVLATEVAQHGFHVSNFTNALKNATYNSPAANNNKNNNNKSDSNNLEQQQVHLDITKFKTKENVDYVKRILLKCADVSNPSRPLHLAVRWAQRISEEFLRQTDEEIERNLPLSMAAYRRSTCSIPTSQLGFFDFIISDLYKAWHEFMNLPELMKNYEINYTFWKVLEMKNIRTIEEVQNYLANNSNLIRNSENDGTTKPKCTEESLLAMKAMMKTSRRRAS